MAHVQWCIGNTTLREAARLKDGKGVNTAAANKLTLYLGFTMCFFRSLKFNELNNIPPAGGRARLCPRYRLPRLVVRAALGVRLAARFVVMQ